MPTKTNCREILCTPCCPPLVSHFLLRGRFALLSLRASPSPLAQYHRLYKERDSGRIVHHLNYCSAPLPQSRTYCDLGATSTSRLVTYFSTNCCQHDCSTPSTGPQELKLEGLVIDEWRGAVDDGKDIVCDAVGNVCPWRVANGTNAMDWNISAAAAVLMVCSMRAD